MTFLYEIKRKGPKTVPWGTPDMTRFSVKVVPAKVVPLNLIFCNAMRHNYNTVAAEPLG